MKKVLTIIALMFVAIAASAQEEVTDTTKKSNPVVEKMLLDRTFSITDNALMFSRTTKVSRSNFGVYEWTLKNDHIGDSNIIVFDIRNKKTGERIAHQSWSDGAHILMEIRENGDKAYYVLDDLFTHLTIIQAHGSHAVILNSIMRK